MGVFSFGTDLWDPSNRFQTSWLLSPWLLFACRALIGIYALATRIVSIIYRCSSPNHSCGSASRSFSFFTILTFWGIAFYFLITALHTATYALRGANRSTLDAFPRPLQALHSLFYTSIVVYPFVVSIVYWAALYRGGWFDTTLNAWENITQHGLNSAFALFEIIVPRTAAPPWIHLLCLIFILALYLGLAYLTYATQGFYVYSFLDYEWAGSRGIVAAYIIGIAVGAVIIFCVVWGLIRLRLWVTETKLRMDGKTAKQRLTRRPDVEMST